MSDFGIKPEGFVRKRLSDIITEKEDATKVVFGPDVNLNVQSPEGQVNQNSALSDDQLWQIAEESYNATDPDKATGISLSNLVKLNSISRLLAIATTVTLTCTGTATVVVPVGQLVSDGAGLQVITLTAFTFDGGGNATVEAELVETGPTPIPINSMTVIDTPVTGWATVDNLAIGVEGRNRETDGELRLRRSQSTAASSRSTASSLFGAVGNVEGVTSLAVFDNDTDSVDADGVPAHSFEVVVSGGDDTDVANAILANTILGIPSTGTTSVQVPDSQGSLKTIKFTRPVDIPIFVDVTLNKRAGYPLDGDASIKQAIVDYADGLLVEGRGFSVNDDVIFTELYTPINTVPEHDITDLRIGVSASPTGTSNITIAIRETSKFTIANINIL